MKTRHGNFDHPYFTANQMYSGPLVFKGDPFLIEALDRALMDASEHIPDTFTLEEEEKYVHQRCETAIQCLKEIQIEGPLRKISLFVGLIMQGAGRS